MYAEDTTVYAWTHFQYLLAMDFIYKVHLMYAVRASGRKCSRQGATLVV